MACPNHKHATHTLNEENMYDIVIVGAGVAGFASALYALRSGKSVLILESETIGGQIALSPRVENFPTIKQISGSELTEKMMEQVVDMGAEIELDKVEKIEKIDNVFKIKTEYSDYDAKSVILATGVKPRQIGVEREEELVGKGVSYCAVCDGAFFQDEEVCLIGDANTALQYAILLSNTCKKVTVCTLFDKFFGEQKLQDTLRSRSNVEIHHNLQLQELLGQEELSGLVFKNTKDNSILKIDAKGVFICIGQVPNNQAFKDLVDLDEQGYFVADESCKTKTDGLFVAGDARTKKVRQVLTAVSDGAIASLSACGYVDNLKFD